MIIKPMSCLQIWRKCLKNINIHSSYIKSHVSQCQNIDRQYYQGKEMGCLKFRQSKSSGWKTGFRSSKFTYFWFYNHAISQVCRQKIITNRQIIHQNQCISAVGTSANYPKLFFRNYNEIKYFVV